MKVECLTESNTLEKSKDMSDTEEVTVRREET